MKVKFLELQILTLIIEGVIGAGISFLGWKLKKIRAVEEELQRREKHFEEMEMLNTRMNLIRECNHYLEKGYTNSKISHTIEEGENGVKVTFVIDEGANTVIKEIKFTGNTITSSRALKAKLQS